MSAARAKWLMKLTMFACASILSVASMGQPSTKIEEGFDYRVLPIAQPVATKGKVEVIEFFWYGCPHCYDFEPELSAWVKRQGKDVTFRRVPVAFRDDLLPHTQLFYALEAMGKADVLNEKVMFAIHKQNKKLLTESEIADWVASQGVDRNTFLAAYRSFTVVSKAKASNAIAEAYRIDGVPTVVIQGKYITSPSIATSKAKAIAVMDYLVERVR